MNSSKIHNVNWFINILREEGVRLNDVDMDTVQNNNGKIKYKTKTSYYTIDWEKIFTCIIVSVILVGSMSSLYTAELGIAIFAFVLSVVSVLTYIITLMIFENNRVPCCFTIISAMATTMIYLIVLDSVLPTDQYWYTEREIIHWIHRTVPEWVYKFKI